MNARIAVIGAGAWGTALAIAATRAGRDVRLWARDPAQAEALRTTRTNAAYLPQANLPAEVEPTSDLAFAVDGAAAILLAVPAQHLGGIARLLPPGTAPLVICAKGIERGTGRLMNEIVAEAAPGRPAAILSGPTFASEVAAGLPTAVTLAAADERIGRELVTLLGSPTFRPYWSSDPVGALIGGAVKNVIAIACGIVAGRGLGENARAALMTRGLAEIVRLGVAAGGRPDTFIGLAGLGDLALTASSSQSRNFSLGMALGEGRSLDEILGQRRTVTEGVTSATATLQRAAALGVEMPITAAVAAIVAGQLGVEDAMRQLLARPFRAEGSDV